MSRRTRLLVTVDVERDYAPEWRTPSSFTCRSVEHALPRLLQPLCDSFAVRPTYLVGAEVLVCPPATAALRALAATGNCELGAHLHAEYVPPGPRPADWCSPKVRIATMQGDLDPADEAQRLATLTELFAQQIGRRPTAFRAGRFGAGLHTARILRGLGYTVDSSVTPGVAWRNPNGELCPDYRGLAHRPWRVADDGDLKHSGNGPLLEVPVTVVSPQLLGRGDGDPVWLRPWYSDRATLLAILEAAARDDDAGRPWHSLCMMFHSMELVAGASPYPQTEADVDRYLEDLEAVFARAQALGFESRTMSEFERAWTQSENAPLQPTVVDTSSWRPDAAAAPSRRVHLDGLDPAPLLAAHAVQPWFLYSFESRPERWDNCLAYEWIAANTKANDAVLDVGCGPGFNLHWLFERGHRELFGCDLDDKAIAAARDLAARTGRTMQFWVDDGRTLAGAPVRPFAAIAAMNWIQLVPDFDLDAFLQRATAMLADDGVLVFDFIDRAYEQNPFHEYLTSDWNKPIAERRPSEYRTRFAIAELHRALQRRGLAIAQCWRIDGPVPRGVVACRRAAQPSATTTPTARPRVVYVVDAEGWAHDHKAKNLVRCLADRYDGRIVYQDRATARDLDASDLVVLFYWRQLQSMPQLADWFAQNRHRLLLGICSHNELEGEFRTPGLAALRRLPRAVFTHSQLLENEWRPLVGGASWCLPNGVDSTFYCPAPNPRAPQRGVLRVGWAGSVANFGAEMRGLPNVIEPAIALTPGAELVVAARESRLRTAEEMRAFYRDLDVYVCASRVEGTPNPCLEAAACGVPIVTTAVGNMPELLADGDGGVIVTRDVQAFATAFAQLRDDPQRRLAMRRAIRTTIEREWDWQQRAEAFAAMFAAALAAPRGRELAIARVRAGEESMARGDRSTARDQWTQALDADGSLALAHVHLAELLWAEGTPDAALLALGHQRTAIKLGANDAAVRAVLQRLLSQQGKQDLAEALAR